MLYSSTSQETLRGFVNRRHPDYDGLVDHWSFLTATYKGGRDWFDKHLFQYHKEGSEEFAARLGRAFRFNHTREVVDLVQKYIFKSPATRNEADATVQVKDFWANATLSGLSISQFMGSVSTESSKKGSVWIFTDSTAPIDGEPVSVADAKLTKDRAYAYTVDVEDVLDVGFDEQGGLTWIVLREWIRDDADGILSSGDVSVQYRLWTKTQWFLFVDEAPAEGKEKQVVQIGQGINGFGEVPCFRVDHVISSGRYSVPGLIDDIAYLDRAVANYLSNIDAIIQDQTFSQLIIPAQGIEPGTSPYDSLIEAGTKRAFTYDSEGGGKPEYISPDPKQAALILQVVNKIISEIYHTVGMAGERTKQDNAVGIDNSSGVAKAYDFERVNSLLVAKAASIENAENELVRHIMKWNGDLKGPDNDLVKYPETFDVRSLFDEFTIAENLQLVEAPDLVRQEQMKLVIDKLFPRLAIDLRAKMVAQLASWPPKIDPLTPTKPAGSTAKPAAKKRQGQVTKSTV